MANAYTHESQINPIEPVINLFNKIVDVIYPTKINTANETATENSNVFGDLIAYAETQANNFSKQTGISAEYLLESIGHNKEILQTLQEEYTHLDENLAAINTIQKAAKKGKLTFEKLNPFEITAAKHYLLGTIKNQENYLKALKANHLVDVKQDEMNATTAALGAASMDKLVPAYLSNTYRNEWDNLRGITTSNISTKSIAPKTSIWTENDAKVYISSILPKKAVKPILAGLIIAGIITSGCVDTYALDNDFNESKWQNQLDDGITMKEAYKQISELADSHGLTVDSIETDGDISSIFVKDGNNNVIKIFEDNGDKNNYADRVILNRNTLYPTTAEAESPQTQLSDAPTGGDALYKQITNPDVIRSAMGEPLDNYRIPANVLGTPDREASNGNMWKNVAGFETYREFIGDDGRVEKINFKLDKNTKSISLADKKQIDGKIDIVWANLDTETISLP